MVQFEILLISILRVLVEVAGYSLLGQGLLALLAGPRREQNVFYRILKTITQPVIRLARAITPRVILDAHVPFVAFFLLFWLWIGLAVVKRSLCATHGLQC